MSLNQALATAVAGLRTTQSGLSVISANVANAETPGYVKKVAIPVQIAAGQAGTSVAVSEIQRQLDQYVQRQMRTETSGASYASLRSEFFQRIQTVFGAPGSSTALDTIFNNFTQSLQALSTSPDDPSARAAVLAQAQVLTQQLNSMSTQVQALRADAELGLSDSVDKANNAMKQIASINAQLSTYNKADSTTASLLDQRDAYISQLAQLMDITVVPGDQNQVKIFTTSGIQLVGSSTATLHFDAQGTIAATNQWSADPTKRSVGTLTLSSENGSSIDLIASGSIRSGEIAAYLQMRDQDLVQTQTQLDQMAAAMASALSNQTVGGTAVTSGAQKGFDVDLGGLLAGNSINLTYVDAASGQTRKITFLKVDDPAALPLSNSATPDPNDQVFGLDFSGGMSSVLTQINNVLTSKGLIASTTGGSMLRVLDNGSGRATASSLSTTSTMTGFSSGGGAMPFFTDGVAAYTGAINSLGSQSVGFASRIAVNPALINDPAALVSYQTGTTSADPTRPSFLYTQLTGASQTFSASSGVGTASAPYTGSIGSFLRQVISQQGQAAESAKSLSDGQNVVLSSLQARFDDSASVNIDEEMSNLLRLQNTYAANARVMSAVREMLNSLMSALP
ncbi:MAG: flagellar hook-associated protein FlgK [Pseudolabrys sp.]